MRKKVMYGKVYGWSVYIAAVANSDAAIDSEWLSWAKRKADWYDPTIALEDETIFIYVVKSLVVGIFDLLRFLLLLGRNNLQKYAIICPVTEFLKKIQSLGNALMLCQT